MRMAMRAKTVRHRIETAATFTEVPDTLVTTSRNGGMNAARTTNGSRLPVSVRCQSTVVPSDASDAWRARRASSSPGRRPVDGCRAATAMRTYWSRNSQSQKTPVW